MTDNRIPAILLGGRETAVPAARSLAAAGIPVHAVGLAGGPLRRSRAVESYTAIEGPDLHARWLEWLAARPEPGVIMPAGDDVIELVATHRAEISAMGHVLFEADDGVIRAMLDKDLTYAIAERGRVPAPAAVSVRTEADIAVALERLSFPCGVKPLVSHRFVAATGITDKVLTAADAGELERLLRLGLDAGSPLMATEIIPGPDSELYGYLTYVTADGDVVYEMTNRKLRQDPPHFGVGCYVVNQFAPEVMDVGRRFVRAAGLIGTAHVEFKRDPRDGVFKLIECNHRFHLGLQLIRAAGVELPQIAYERALGRAVSAPEPRYGARLWHPVPDLRSLRESRRAGELTTWQWARSLMHRQHFTVWSAADPVPSLEDHARIVRGYVARRLRRRRSAAMVEPSAELGHA